MTSQHERVSQSDFDTWTKHGRSAGTLARHRDDRRRLRQTHRRYCQQLHPIRPRARAPARRRAALQEGDRRAVDGARVNTIASTTHRHGARRDAYSLPVATHPDSVAEWSMRIAPMLCSESNCDKITPACSSTKCGYDIPPSSLRRQLAAKLVGTHDRDGKRSPASAISIDPMIPPARRSPADEMRGLDDRCPTADRARAFHLQQHELSNEASSVAAGHGHSGEPAKRWELSKRFARLVELAKRINSGDRACYAHSPFDAFEMR